jgi:hypothetical protein
MATGSLDPGIVRRQRRAGLAGFATMKSAALFACLALPAAADPPEVVVARAVSGVAGWSIGVTLRHPDTGWDHYADAWRVEAPDGTVLGERVLLHPHETEQPFTRGLDRVAIPGNLDHVLIRPRCLIDGWSEATFRVPLTP